MLVGIDVGDAGVMTFEEQAVGGDNAELVLERRHAPIGPVLLVDKHITASATDVCLELRWHPVRRGLDDATHFEVRLRDFQPFRPGASDPGRRRDGRAGQDRAAAQKPASRLRLGELVSTTLSVADPLRDLGSRAISVFCMTVSSRLLAALFVVVFVQRGFVAIAVHRLCAT